MLRLIRSIFVWSCAVLVLAVAFSWVRSYWRCDEIGYYTHKPAPPGKGRDCRNIVGSNRGGFYWLSMEADITCEVDWYGGEPTEIITSSAAEPRLASDALETIMGTFAFVPRWERGGFRLEAWNVSLPVAAPMVPSVSATAATVPVSPGGWYRGVVVPHWAWALPLCFPPAVRLRRNWIRWRWRKKGLCHNCGYDVRYSGDVCSECGCPRFTPPRPARIRLTRKKAAVAGIVLAMGGGLCIYLVAPEADSAVRLGRATTLPAGQLPRRVELDIGNGVAMRFALIPAGRFVMGSPLSEAGRTRSEKQREVAIGKPFYMGVTTVTQSQWKALMGTSVKEQRDKAQKHWPIYGEGDGYAAYYVSWHEALEFCAKLSQQCGRRVRLPTEPEWEYACRAGTTTPFNTGWTLPVGRADYRTDNTYPRNRHLKTAKGPRMVGSYRPNAWGLYDMHGSVQQWCSDTYGRYPGDTDRVLRGGSWDYEPENCRSALRRSYPPIVRDYDIGFRVCMDPN